MTGPVISGLDGDTAGRAGDAVARAVSGLGSKKSQPRMTGRGGSCPNVGSRWLFRYLRVVPARPESGKLSVLGRSDLNERCRQTVDGSRLVGRRRAGRLSARVGEIAVRPP